MPDFQETALHLLETAGTVHFDKRKLQHLTGAFRASFLHYTRRDPGHWSHPRRRWNGQPDRASVAAPVLMLFCRLHGTDFPTQETDALLECWVQFMAAMLPTYTEEDASVLIPVLREAAELFPEEKHYPILLSALQAIRKKERKKKIFSADNGYNGEKEEEKT